MTPTPAGPFTFYFVRHGVTDLNFKGLRCGGDVDVPLLDMGCDQAFLLAKQIAHMDLGIETIISSSLVRTRQTAMIISAVLGGVPIIEEPLFNERRLGAWNNRPIDETEDLIRRKVPPPGGESEEEFTKRIEDAVDAVKPMLVRRPLIVSSKGVGRILNAILGGEERLLVANGEVVEFSGIAQRDGSFALKVSRPHQF
jgi:probable phosphoglycerate mutase